jgi:uncharacterized protein YndB with AHSA1/START domain
MTARDRYTPGPAHGAHVDKEGERWRLVLVRTLRHPPVLVWEALTEPEHLREWAPFDASGSLATQGATVSLTTVGAPAAQVSEAQVTRAEAPRVLEYAWGGQQIRWELAAIGEGTRLTLWHSIDRRYIAMGAAGWHVCLDVLEHALDGDRIGRIVGADALAFEGWQRLHAEYSAQFGVEPPSWGSTPAQGA